MRTIKNTSEWCNNYQCRRHSCAIIRIQILTMPHLFSFLFLLCSHLVSFSAFFFVMFHGQLCNARENINRNLHTNWLNTSEDKRLFTGFMVCLLQISNYGEHIWTGKHSLMVDILMVRHISAEKQQPQVINGKDNHPKINTQKWRPV